MRKFTLFIDGWSSTCGNCGKGCNPDEKQHNTNLGYDITDETRKGCGIKWKYVAHGMTGISPERIKQMRPDLEYLDFWTVLKSQSNQ